MLLLRRKLSSMSAKHTYCEPAHQVDFLRTKLIDDAKRSNPQYRGLVHGTMSIVKQEGIFGIYRGLFPVVMVDLYTSLKEGVYVCIDDASRS